MIERALMDKIPAISVKERDGKMIVKAGDYSLSVYKSGTVWRFDERRSTLPSMGAHFDLRKQVHNALNAVAI